MSTAHPLYTAVERLMQRGTSPDRLYRLYTLMQQNSLAIPVDLHVALSSAGYLLA